MIIARIAGRRVEMAHGPVRRHHVGEILVGSAEYGVGVENADREITDRRFVVRHRIELVRREADSAATASGIHTVEKSVRPFRLRRLKIIRRHIIIALLHREMRARVWHHVFTRHRQRFVAQQRRVSRRRIQ